ncbi:MAG: response regulator, partial [Bacteroidota bacterium]
IFFFDLDLAYSEQPHREQMRHQKSRDFQAAKILVVDDVRYNRLLIEKLLKTKNVQLDFAENGREALQHLEQRTYDLIFMDIQMPVMDGIEATYCIRARAIKTTIIALTAMDNTEQNKFFEAGMNGFIAKPFSPKDFYACIEKHISLKTKPSVAKSKDRTTF